MQQELGFGVAMPTVGRRHEKRAEAERLLLAGQSAVDVAKTLGISRRRVAKWRRLLDLPKATLCYRVDDAPRGARAPIRTLLERTRRLPGTISADVLSTNDEGWTASITEAARIKPPQVNVAVEMFRAHVESIGGKRPWDRIEDVDGELGRNGA